MVLQDSSKFTTKHAKFLEKNGDATIYDKKENLIDFRDHQITLLGYTSGEFDTIQEVSKKQKKSINTKEEYNMVPLNYDIAIYMIVVV